MGSRPTQTSRLQYRCAPPFPPTQQSAQHQSVVRIDAHAQRTSQRGVAMHHASQWQCRGALAGSPRRSSTHVAGKQRRTDGPERHGALGEEVCRTFGGARLHVSFLGSARRTRRVGQVSCWHLCDGRAVLSIEPSRARHSTHFVVRHAITNNATKKATSVTMSSADIGAGSPMLASASRGRR